MNSPTLKQLLSSRPTTLRSGKTYRMLILMAQQVKEGKTVVMMGCTDPAKIIATMKEIGVNAICEDGVTFKLKG